MNRDWENPMPGDTDSESRKDIDFHFRRAVGELSRSDDRQFARSVRRISAAGIFAAAISVALPSF